MIIDNKIRSYLKQTADDMGSVLEFARRLGVYNTTVRGWINGNVKKISNDNWKKTLYYIKPYMPITEYQDYVNALKNPFFDNLSGGVTPSSKDVDIENRVEGNKFPILSEAAAASVNTLAFPISDYAKKYAEDFQFFPNGKDGDFAIRVNGDSMLPWYPSGTILLVRQCEIKNGDRVIAILENGEIMFKVFAHKQGAIGLFSINGCGKDYSFRNDDFCQIRNLYKVISSIRDEEKLDSAMSDKNIRHSWQDKLDNL